MDTPARDARIAGVVALKNLPEAKSRMAALPPPVRERLARCMAHDTITALSPAVDEVLVISDQPDLTAALTRYRLQARVIADPTADPERGSLNSALAQGDALLRAEGVDCVLACVGDLPALRTESVRRVLAASVGRERAFLADHDGSGTTMLIARRTPLDPLYGMGMLAGASIASAARHRLSGAHPLRLDDLPDARWDVDTLDDLRVASEMGLGTLTAAMVDPGTGTVGDYVPVTVAAVDAETITVLVAGRAEQVVRRTYDGDPAHLVPGRRLHAVRVLGSLRCWQ